MFKTLVIFFGLSGASPHQNGCVRPPNRIARPLSNAPGPESLVSTKPTSFIVGYETTASGFQRCTCGPTPKP
jgi:hypothetical protein